MIAAFTGIAAVIQVFRPQFAVTAWVVATAAFVIAAYLAYAAERDKRLKLQCPDRIKSLCEELDKVERHEYHKHLDLAETAKRAGLVVEQCLAAGAFRANPRLEIDLKMIQGGHRRKDVQPGDWMDHPLVLMYMEASGVACHATGFYPHPLAEGEPNTALSQVITGSRVIAEYIRQLVFKVYTPKVTYTDDRGATRVSNRLDAAQRVASGASAF